VRKSFREAFGFLLQRMSFPSPFIVQPSGLFFPVILGSSRRPVLRRNGFFMRDGIASLTLFFFYGSGPSVGMRSFQVVWSVFVSIRSS